MSRPVTVLLAALAFAVAGCGRDRREPGDAAPPAAPTASAVARRVTVPRAGVSLEVPRNLVVTTPRSGSTVLEAALADSFVSVFAYRRSEQLPRSARELDAARRRLVASARERGRSFRVITSRTLRVDGAPAVELLGTEDLGGGAARVRSLHVYRDGVETVVEIGAPDADFAAFDRRTRPMVARSLRLG